MHDNRHACSPVIITIALNGTRMAHRFIQVCTLIYNGASPSTFARHLGHQYLPQTGEDIPCLLARSHRCSRHQSETCCTAQSAWAAWRTNGCSVCTPCQPVTSANRRCHNVDQCQPQIAGCTRTGMRGRRDSRPVAGTRPGSSVKCNSRRGVRCKAIPQLGDVAPDVRMGPLPAVGAWQGRA